MSPNPLKPIQQAASHVDTAAREVLDRVLAMTTIDESAADLGRSVTSGDDLAKHLDGVVERIARVERHMEQLLPLVERLVVSAEALHEDLAPVSSLAARIPGSGARRRRRARQVALTAGVDPTPAPAPPTEEHLPAPSTDETAPPPTP